MAMRRRWIGMIVALSGCASAHGELPGPGVVPAPAVASPVLDLLPVGSRPNLTAAEVWSLHDRLVACLMTPQVCEPSTFTAQDSAAEVDLWSMVDSRRASGLEARASTAPPQRRLLRRWPTGSVWHVELCWVDDLVLYQPGGPGDPTVMVDTTELTLDETWTVTHRDGSPVLTTRMVTRMVPGVAPWCG